MVSGLTQFSIKLQVTAMKFGFSVLLSVCGLLVGGSAASAQSIGGQELTTVTSVGNQFDITGGVPAGNNLFHSFDRFNLSAVQTANFQVPGTIQNVLSRVTGGTPSVINGIVQSTGGTQPNFYFMNPAGIVFGPNFNLNIPGSFTATTANGIAFGNNWMNATGANNYALFLGNPTAFGLTMAQPAAIINNAALTPNQSVTLIAGTIVSPGALTLSDGTLTIAAVPGNSLVRVTSAGTILGLEIRPFQVAETQPNALVAAVPSLAQLVTGPAPGGGTVGDATGVSVNPDGSLTLTGAGMSIRPGDVQVAALEGNGVLVGAPVGNVVVDTILSRDLGVDITAGKLFQATKTFAPSEYRSLFQELLPTPNSELMAFLKLKTGLSDADLISKYPGGLTLPHANFPTLASIFVRRGITPGNANVVIRHGAGSQLDLQGRSGATVTGAAPFSVGGQVTLDAPGDLANRYSFVNPAQTFANLVASTPGGAIESQDGVFDLRRNQSTAAIPIPANSSGTVGAIVQTVRGDGGLTVSFANQLFGTSLPPNPTNPGNPGTPNPTTPANSSTNPTTATPTSADGSAIANAQQGGERGSAANNQCAAGSVKMASGQVKDNQTRSASPSGQADCPSGADSDTAILKILE
jgi:filamentous hemagglutinin family protein